MTTDLLEVAQSLLKEIRESAHPREDISLWDVQFLAEGIIETAKLEAQPVHECPLGLEHSDCICGIGTCDFCISKKQAAPALPVEPVQLQGYSCNRCGSIDVVRDDPATDVNEGDLPKLPAAPTVELPMQPTLSEWLDGKEFYELMQAYRWADPTGCLPQEAVDAFEAVKSAIRSKL